MNSPEETILDALRGSGYFADSFVSTTARPLYSPHFGQARWGSFFSWQFGHSERPDAVRKSWARRLAVRRAEWRLLGFGMMQFLSCSSPLRPHTVSFAFRPGSNTSISGISGPAADSVSPAAPAKTNAGSETHLPSQPNRLLFRTLSGRVARPAPPSGGRSDPHRRNIAGCYGSDHSAGKVLCSQACTAS